MATTTRPTAFVTGGGSGIGRALAKALAARGTTVCVADTNVAAAEAVAKECGDDASSLSLDVRDAAAMKRSIEEFATQNGRLDYMFNNAGIGIAGEVDDIPLSGWHRIVDINVYGVLHGVLAAYPIMLEQGFGHIVNTASLAGLGPAPLFTPYALTKHAVVGLSTSLRIEAASRGVRVSVVCPAAVETPLLDAENPGDLGIGWAPDARRFLTAMAGPPYPVEKCADDILAALDKNKSVIVLPGRARLAWRLGRLFPALVEKIGLSAVAKERSSRA
ncbi:SDR family oxidoreductase [Phreatobacter aquaticus]|uniref:SDR family oxidoreductase n=1 Tax=Phreatobacter aquaticus TaxID=2570229 RepID=A0A4D7QLU2_9HYPH|nr:SDR family oxidoreductase [Phreatobacter aquaticus]QCK86366.1 SDR family oxidoreductase [Phreatobacter aquaticus]